MADQREEGNCKIKVVVKTSKKKETIETEPTATIKEFKEAVSSKFGYPVSLLCLIFAGRILKDEETLASYSIKDGLTVHLVIKSDNRAQQQAAQHASEATHQASSQPANSQSQSSESPSLQFGQGLGGNLQQMSQQLMANPDLMRQVMDNPMVQGMMSNPDLVRQMILSNPQMQQLIERNPEISHILNNPDLMRQTMEMVRNPSLMTEMMRTHDRALSNLLSLPGGFNTLQRMYTDIQEPMLNATREQMQNNPFSALFGGSSGTGSGAANPTSNPQQGTENTSPLPNPWVSSSQSSPAMQRSRQETNPPPTTTTSSTASTAANPSGVNADSTSSTGQSSPMSGMFQTPAMQSLMQQISGNPDMFQNLMQSPYMQNMMRHMVQNPELMSSIIRSSPMFQGNNQLADQVAARLPEYMTQMQSPELQQAMTNPRVMEALMQIQQGMTQLQTEAPGLVPGTGLMGVPPATVTNTSGSTTATTNTTAAPSGQTTASSPDPQRPQGGTQEGTQGNNMLQLMSQMMQAMTQTQSPEVTYRAQLDQLAQMGFVDRARNIQALQATGGDINAAIERLLQ